MDRYAFAAVKANTSLQLLNAVQTVVLRLGVFGVVSLAAFEVLHGRMSPGSIAACILIMQTVYIPLNVLGMFYRMIRQSFIDMEQMIDLQAVKPERHPLRQHRLRPSQRLRVRGLGRRRTGGARPLHQRPAAGDADQGRPARPEAVRR